jgi:hypothetical protein
MSLKLEKEVFALTDVGNGPVKPRYTFCYGINLFRDSKRCLFFDIGTYNFENFNVSMSERPEGKYRSIAKGVSWEKVNQIIDARRVDPKRVKVSFLQWLFNF